MRKFFIFLTASLFFFVFFSKTYAVNDKDKINTENTALIIIDIQEFYFPGGMLPLFNPEKAAGNAKDLLTVCREKGIKVIHVKHNASSGSKIHKLVAPRPDEKVITKNKANAFVGTDLLAYLKENKIENLILCGMQTHMCLEAATRAASDLGFNCTVVEDACATRDLKYEDITIKASDVHYSTLSTLQGTYANVVTLGEYLNILKN